MRLCLIPLKTEPRNPALNLQQVRKRLNEARAFQPDLVCLPECALTGYLWEEKDLATFAEPIPGETVQRMANLARSDRIHLCFGMIESAAEGFYNTALLLNPNGEILLKHRKVNEQPPYRSGAEVGSAKTELGRIGILICGDLFHAESMAKIAPNLDLLLVPMSRGFADISPDPQRWMNEERQAYLVAVKKVGRTAAIVNALENLPEEGAFGGAMVVSASGELLAESPHGTDELLLIDLRF
ncbi:MAG: carbon-nitrogen hydrolase family protein [Anaerolineales bacterium]|nr:carbon-nitrogen hydrolase family protein [Anaerolineales bacterium]MDW8162251.1 carbon-nitrogen hydrolase family protein [Anaerolineales bacterium]